MLNVSVFSNPTKDKDLKSTNRLLKFLYEHKAKIFMSERCVKEISEVLAATSLFLNQFDITVLPEDQLFTETQFGIVLGGDGTILRVAKSASTFNFLILGINLGKVGYIAELEIDEIEYLKDVLKLKNINEIESLPDCTIDRRMMLSVEIVRENSVVFSGIALNDAVISKGSISKMINIAIKCNGKSITNYRADGIILSTPTGSTAYSMSAGGPLIDPTIECICSIPVCPYLCLNKSPVIYSDNSVIDIVYSEQKSSEAYLTIDGKGGKRLLNNDIVRIYKSPCHAKLLRIKRIDFYKLLNIKISKNLEN